MSSETAYNLLTGTETWQRTFTRNWDFDAFRHVGEPEWGATYSLSFECESTAATSVQARFNYVSAGGEYKELSDTPASAVPAGTSRVTLAIHAPAERPADYAEARLMIQAQLAATDGAVLTVSRPMLVRGAEPAAWAPAEGEELAGGGALVSANLLKGAGHAESVGTTYADGTWLIPAETAGKTVNAIDFKVAGQPTLAENQRCHIGASVRAAVGAGARLWAGVAYKDAAGHHNYVGCALSTMGSGGWQRVEGELVVPSGMVVDGAFVHQEASRPAVELASPVLSYGGPVVLASAGHVATKTEWLRKGLYEVDQPDSYGGTIQLSCLDMLTRLEVPFSSLGLEQFPYKASELLAKVFSACGVLLRTGSFSPVYDPELSRVPNGTSVSALQVASYVAQLMGGWIRCDSNGDAVVSWYDSSAIEAETWADGGTLSGDATPYGDGARIDGGTFASYSSGASADGGTFASNKTVGHVYDPKNVTVSTDDVVITGVEVTAQNEVVVGNDGKETNGRDGETYLAGKSGYVLHVGSNPLVEYGTAKALADALYGRVGGMRFRAFSATAPSDPSIEAGDPIVVADYTGATHVSYVTGLKLVVDGSETFRCSAKTPSRNSAAGASAATQAIVATRNEVRRATSEIELARESLERKIAEKSGLYHSEERLSDGSTVHYLHDKPTIGTSQVVWKMAADAVGVSTDGGATYSVGMTAQGDAVLKRVYAIGIDATHVTTGTISDAKGYNRWDLDTGEFRLSSTTTIGGKTASAIANDAVSSQTQADIFNRLTNNGQTQGIYLSGGKLYINATYMKTGVISDSSGNNSWNLTSGYLTTTHGKIGGFTIASTSIYNDTVAFSSDGVRLDYTYGGTKRSVGHIGVNCLQGDASKYGLVFDLENNASLMAWAWKESTSDHVYTYRWVYASRAFGGYSSDTLNAGCDIDMHKYKIRNLGGGITQTFNYTKASFRSDGTASQWGNGTMTFTNGILTNLTYIN